MQNNSPVATPVNVVGVVFSPDYPVSREQFGGDPKAESVISGAPCQLHVLTGYNSDPSATQLYVQLHELDQLPIPAGHIPKVVIPVLGGKTPFSLAQGLTFSPGLAIGISTLEWEYASAGAFLCWQCTYGTET